jgi:hypothetical protein
LLQSVTTLGPVGASPVSSSWRGPEGSRVMMAPGMEASVLTYPWLLGRRRGTCASTARATMGLVLAVSAALSLSSCRPNPDDVTRSEAGPDAAVLIERMPDGSRIALVTYADGKKRQCALDGDGHITNCSGPV